MPLKCFDALVAKRYAGNWQVGRKKVARSTIREADRARAEAQINARMGNQEARLASFHLVWQQELPITTFVEGLVAFAAGEEWADRLLSEDSDVPMLSGLPNEISRFVAETALERGGARVAGGWRRRSRLRLILDLAILAALVWLAISIVRSLRWQRLVRQDARTVVALHTEAANRTKHVRKALAGRNPADTQVLFVGRLHMGRAAAEEMLAEAGWRHGFALAWDWRAALAGIPEGLRIVRQAPAAIDAAGFRPAFAQLAAIVLRIFLGTASAWRWKRADRSADTVVFGHVGRADTILPEAAMQAGGARTVHWMHGVTVGRAYQGVSNLCVTLCGHDARWHDAILNYRSNRHFPVPRPAFRMGGRPGWAVLTNMTHYGYTHFPSVGPAHELQLIDLVAELARREGVDPSLVTWKPHPVFYQSDPDTRALVTRKLGEAGLTLWPSESMPFDETAAFETLIVAPSGAALDMLKAGRLPVLTEFQPIDPGHVLAQLEPRCHDLESLAAALAVARDRKRAEALFAKVWERAEPGEAGTLEQIERALRG